MKANGVLVRWPIPKRLQPVDREKIGALREVELVDDGYQLGRVVKYAENHAA